MAEKRRMLRDTARHEYDFANATKPELTPLKNSFAVDEIEAELKALTLQVFEDTLAKKTFDLNVSGSAHLGSFDLVRRSITTDGLALTQADRREEAVRYLYRAWMARDNQARGLHFLRTYLQLLYPNVCTIEQVWHDKDVPYPLGQRTRLDEDDLKIDPQKMYLTSRVQMALDWSVTTWPITALMDVFRSILPARLTPQFRFVLRFFLQLDYDIWTQLTMRKTVTMHMPWFPLVVTERKSAQWNLGKDEDPAAAPHLLRYRNVSANWAIFKYVSVSMPWNTLLVTENPAKWWHLGQDQLPYAAPRIRKNTISLSLDGTKKIRAQLRGYVTQRQTMVKPLALHVRATSRTQTAATKRTVTSMPWVVPKKYVTERQERRWHLGLDQAAELSPRLCADAISATVTIERGA